MIEVSPLDYHVSGFRAFRVCDSEEDLAFHRDLPFFMTSWSEDINHHQIRETTKTHYPANRLYEFKLDQPKAEQADLKRAIQSAKASAEEDGLKENGHRIYELILVADESARFWIRVGIEWTE